MKRKPPKTRHKEPFWSAPRRATERRRVESHFAFLKERMVQTMRRSVVALGEGPGIRPLTRGQRTQVIWRRGGGPIALMLTFRPPCLDRWLALFRVKEGTPLCN